MRKGVGAALAMAMATAMTSVVASSGTATAGELTGAELHALLAGRTIHISVPFGSLPIRYNPGGTMAAKSKAMAVYSGGITEDHGTWRIAGNKFCQRWKTWQAGREQCFSVSRSGSTLRWASNDGMTGTAH
ncbi:hypothetical protein [Hyphomicrobium sp.]|uniref:hypothetical protein n=1 Tax=Hyphomicrobium sp. TaxID=82 RepID=UPI002D76E87B|nr:hypothetical protein [Hyphomicrobium sp.]HET6390966.1 hypothetical protein [Hyphomicrobium sp.]